MAQDNIRHNPNYQDPLKPANPARPQAPRPSQPQQQHTAPPPPAAHEPPRPPQPPDELLQEKVPASNIDPAVLQIIMQVAAAAAAGAANAMRQPTAAEQAKIDKEIERVRQQSIQAAKIGAMVREVEEREQSQCGHVNPRGDHLFRGQMHSDGTAMVQCQRCHVTFTDLVTTPQMKSNGSLNLNEVRGLTIEHLKQWKKNSPALRHHFEEVEKVQQAPINPTAPEPLGV